MSLIPSAVTKFMHLPLNCFAENFCRDASSNKFELHNQMHKYKFVLWCGFQVPAVYEEMILSGCTPDRKARAMLRSALRYMKQTIKS